jgi:hypothetical protein
MLPYGRGRKPATGGRTRHGVSACVGVAPGSCSYILYALVACTDELQQAWPLAAAAIYVWVAYTVALQ